MEVKTKFKLGDIVWCLFNQKAIKFEIKKIYLNVSVEERFSYAMYGDDPMSSKVEIDEKDLYTSKEELMYAIFGDDTND